MWTREASWTRFCGRIKSLFDEIHFAGAFWAGEDLAPDRKIDTAFGLSVRVKCLVHPAEFFLDFGEDALARLFENAATSKGNV